MNSTFAEKIEGTDFQEYAELFAHVFNSDPWNENWSEQQALERLTLFRDTPNFLGICAKNKSGVCGFVMGNFEPYQSDRLFILKEMCVPPNYQRSGVGSYLLTQLHENLVELGVSVVNLITREGTGAEKFYLAHNYYRSAGKRLYVASLKT